MSRPSAIPVTLLCVRSKITPLVRERGRVRSVGLASGTLETTEVNVPPVLNLSCAGRACEHVETHG
jgi:hypothetical protein